MSFMQPFLLDPVFFLTTLPCSGGYYLERDGTPSHDDAVMENFGILKFTISIWACRGPQNPGVVFCIVPRCLLARVGTRD